MVTDRKYDTRNHIVFSAYTEKYNNKYNMIIKLDRLVALFRLFTIVLSIILSQNLSKKPPYLCVVFLSPSFIFEIISNDDLLYE
jgi:hypothetical protein